MIRSVNGGDATKCTIWGGDYTMLQGYVKEGSKMSLYGVVAWTGRRD